jgi:peptidoglycan hydrolase-like protein with peptidoglycan-binding domain
MGNRKAAMRYREILEACWTGYRKQGMKKKGSRMVPNCVPVSEEQSQDSDTVRRIQQMLIQEHRANLDVDGVMGPLTLQSIRKFLPAAGAKTAPNPDRNTAVQGYEKKMTTQELEENLHKWFKEKWVRFGPDGKIRGDCARGSSKEGKPKCLPQAKAHALGRKGRASAAARKRREDPNPDRHGAAINVSTRGKRK